MRLSQKTEFLESAKRSWIRKITVFLSNLWKTGGSDRSRSANISPSWARNFNSPEFYMVVAAMDPWERCEFVNWNNWWTRLGQRGTIFEQAPELIISWKHSIKLMIFKHVDWVVPQWLRQWSVVSAYIGGKLGLGKSGYNQLFCLYNGAESILMAYDRIKSGQAKRILAGSTSDSGPIFGGEDAMRVCTFKHNGRLCKVRDPWASVLLVLSQEVEQGL
jgi:hypothetical protein